MQLRSVPLPARLAAGLIFVLVLPPAPGRAAVPRDWVVVPTDAAAPRTAIPAASRAPVCLGCGMEVVEFEDFDGNLHTLERYPGRHVAVLLPAERRPGALEPEEWEVLLDLLDLTYDAYVSLLGSEPQENRYTGLLPIAFIRVPIGGLGLLGNKGVEIDLSLEGDLRRPLRFEGVHQVLIHEMGHNFDLFSPRTAYLRDHPHAWTWWMDTYLPYYMRTGDSAPTRRLDQAGFVRPPRSPREFLRLAVAGSWRPFTQDPEASWERCVEQADCIWWEDQVWGGFHLYLASQFGVPTTRAFFRALDRRIDSGVLLPRDAGGKEELWLEAWAEATQSDVSCYADALHWRDSDALRERLRERYGTRAPLCADRDDDGFRGIEGDCDDRNASIHPGRKDVANGIDDDCDGHVDEQAVKAKKVAVQELPFPAELAIDSVRGDKKEFVFDPGDQEVSWTEICYRGEARGWYFFLEGKKEGLAEGTPGNCIFGKIAPRAGDVVRMRHDTHGDGEYDLIVAPGDPWPVAWASFAEPVVAPKRVRFTVESDLSRIDEKPTHIRFWVSGTGWVAKRKFSPVAHGSWKIPKRAPAGRYGVRAQLLRDGVPISQVSPMTVFEVD